MAPFPPTLLLLRAQRTRLRDPATPASRCPRQGSAAARTSGGWTLRRSTSLPNPNALPAGPNASHTNSLKQGLCSCALHISCPAFNGVQWECSRGFRELRGGLAVREAAPAVCTAHALARSGTATTTPSGTLQARLLTHLSPLHLKRDFLLQPERTTHTQ